MRLLFILLSLGSVYVASAQADSTFTHIYKMDEVDTPPNDITVFSKHVYKHMRYPKYEQDNDIEGQVRVTIVIDETGKVIKPVIIQSAGENMDKEVLRILSTAPVFSPAILKGKPVAVYLEIPINFRLN